jgi:hypothetical protein
VTHIEFTAAYARGEIKVELDPKEAARFISARLLLPLFTMPVLGIGVALALVGWIFTGLAVIALGIIAPRLIKRSAPHFVFQQALNDPAVYKEVTKSGLLRVVRVDDRPLVTSHEQPATSNE